MTTTPELLVLPMPDGGTIPNHPHLPVLVMKQIAGQTEPEARARFFESTWKKHQWRPAWRWGVYPYPHYHSTAHEVLGVFQGRATLRIGGRAGVTLTVEAGDQIILPAGTGHQNLGSSPDFQVVGGYPEGQTADLLRGEPGERPAADERIARVPLPASDPLTAEGGPVKQHWTLKQDFETPRRIRTSHPRDPLTDDGLQGGRP